ncbi:zinc finger protein 691-like [Ochlerotatus camptorhynchus]|uniref:zinc finger protein 691-like n=1 Tax=Ochlerotatus camptorhynchus TaxID=644619 RepID=UPI0031DDAEE8
MEPLCRLCLEGGPDLRPIQDDAQGNSTNTEESTAEQSLVQLVLQYLSIQVIKTECTESPLICTTCQTLIEGWHRFHNTCLKNDEIYQRRRSELFESAVQKQENQVSRSLSTDFKQEELENSAEDPIDDDLDPDFEPLDEDQEEERYSVAVVGSAYTTSEDEMAEKVQPIKRKEKSDSKVIPRKRGRPKVKDIEDADGTDVVMKSRKRAEVCTICGKFIKNMTEHMRIHNNERRHQCPYCPKAFVSASNYCSHVNIHTRAKMYKCDLCDKQYAMLNSLKQHRITHFKERIYLCPVCGKAYYQPTGLARHKRTHFDEPKIKCSECDKMFLTNSDLRKHFTKHLPEKPFNCEICNRAFSRKDNLRTHMKTHRGPKAVKTVAIDVSSDTGPNAPESNNITIKLESPKRDL